MIKKARSLEQIDKELAEIDALLASDAGAPQNAQQNQQVSGIQSPPEAQNSALTQNRSIADIDAELAEIDALLDSEQGGESRSVTAAETAGRAAKGFLASSPGALVDLFLKFANMVGKENLINDSAFSEELKNMNRADAERLIAENQIKPNAQKTLEGAYHDITGFPVRNPGEDKLGDIVQTAGEIVSPGIPGTGPLRNLTKGAPVLSTVGKTLSKDAAMAAGAATALHATPSLTEEGTLGRVAEDFGKMALGSAVGGVAGAKAADAVKSFKDFPGNITEAAKGIKDIPANTVNNLLVGKNPNTEIFELAEKHGIKVPFNVGSDSASANFLANNYLKTIFASDKYRTFLKNSDESMVKSVKEVIDSLGDSAATPKLASDEFKEFLKADKANLSNQVDKLYEEAYELAKNGEKVKPLKTAEFVNSDRIKELINSDTKSDSTKKVLRHIEEIEEGLGINLSKKDITNYTDDPKLQNKIQEELSKNIKEVDINKLIENKKELGRITKYDKDISGVEKYLSGLIGALTEDIKSSKNKAFTSKLEDANQFFRENIAERFKNPKMAQAIMSENVAIDAFNKMNNIRDIRAIEKLSGQSEKGMELFNALKKAKLRELFSSAVTEDSVKTGQFYNLLHGKEAKSEIIKELLGKDQYKKIMEISKIAGEFSKSGRELLNTSGTAMASADINRIESLLKATIYNAGAAATGGYLAGGLPTAVAAVVTPNLVSNIVSNPKFIEQLRKYAISRKAGKQKEADTILKRMITIMNDTENKIRIGKEAVIKNSEEE